MLSSNDTPFAAVGFGDLHRDGMTMAVVCVRATYELSAEGTLRLAAEQSIIYSDVYEGDTEVTPLLHASDLIGFKPAADVTVLGHAHSPGGDPMESWTVAIGIGRHGAVLRVHGPRQWEPTLKRLRPSWKLGTSEPATRVPLDYRLASGGRYAGDPEGDCDRRNPIGAGLLHADWTPPGKRLRAPQIDTEEKPVIEPFGRPEPQGLGPVPPVWRWREQHMGTRDEAWQRNRLPQPPSDFDYRSDQVAHPALVLPRLVGDETVILRGLVPGIRRLDFTLPELAILAQHRWFDGRRADARLTLDGLHLDLRAATPPWSVALTWRGWIATCPAYDGAVVTAVPLAEATGLPVSGEHGLAEAEPAV